MTADSTSVPLAIIEKALYTARLDGDDLVDGTIKFSLKKSGEGTAYLDWSDVNVAISELSSPNGRRVVWGTSDLQQQLVLIDDQTNIEGKWSLHGESLNRLLKFDVTFPPALNSQLELSLPNGFTPIASRGLVKKVKGANLTERSVWKIELGKQHSLKLEILKDVVAPQFSSVTEADTVYVMRRDGVFLQTDLTISANNFELQPIEIKVPKNLVIQSISSSGVQVPFTRTSAVRERITIPVPAGSERLSLRLQAVQSVRWDRRRRLPQFQLLNSTLISQQVAVRSEAPLKISDITASGYLQTSLSKFQTSEVWNYQLVRPNGVLTASVETPRIERAIQLKSLIDARSSTTWSNVLLEVVPQRGSQFHTSIGLPDDWTVITVTPLNDHSKVADWENRNGELQVEFQEPATSETPHRVLVRALCPTIVMDEPLVLQLPTLTDRDAMAFDDVESIYHVLLPQESSFRILDGDAWDILDDTQIQSEMLTGLSEEELVSLKSAKLMTLKTNRANAPPPTVQFLNASTDDFALNDFQLEQTSKVPSVFDPDLNSNSSKVSRDASSVLNVSTVLGHGDSRGMVHHAFLNFDREIDVRSLDLKLNKGVRLSSVIVDGLPVTVILDEDLILFPSEVPSATTIEMIYVTQRQTQNILQINTVPLPTLSIPVESFEWMIKTPVDQHVTDVNLPGCLLGERESQSPLIRFFGPLARLQGFPQIFNPLLAQSWQDLFNLDGAQPKQSNEYTTLQIFAPAAVNEVQMTLRNDAKLRSYSWIMLFACLLIGTGGRMFRVQLIRKASVLWLVTLGLLIALIPEVWSILVGGMLAGTVISLLIPRRIIHATDIFLKLRETPDSDPAPSISQIGAITGVMMICVLSLVRDSYSQISDMALPSPRYLIQAANYEVLSFSPDPKVKAVFQVHCIKTSPDELLLRLPFDDVVFQSGAICLVEGSEQPLIPELDGKGVLVDLGKVEREIDRSFQDSLVTIELTFSIRPQRESNGLPVFEAGIPTVLDSMVLVPNEVKIRDRNGSQYSQASEQSQYALGAIGRLAPQEASFPATAPKNLSAVTLLTPSGLKTTGQSRLTYKSLGEHEAALLSLPLPRNIIVKQVVGDLHQWEVVFDDRGQPLLLLDCPATENSTLRVIDIQFDMIPLAGTKSWRQLVLPQFDFLNGVPFSHSIGLVPDLGHSVLLDDPNANLRMLSNIEWNTLATPVRFQPVLAFEIQQPQEIRLNLAEELVQREVSTREKLVIQKQQIDWSIVAVIEVDKLPVFRHDFHLSPGIEVTSVTKRSGSIEQQVPWKQFEDTLSIQMNEGQFGTQEFVIRGSRSFGPDRWTLLPSLKCLEATMLSSSLSIEDRTMWNLTLETSSKTSLKSPTPPNGTNSADSRVIGVYKDSQRPTRFIAAPPKEATHVESVTRIQSVNDEQWQLSSNFQFHSSEASLTKLQFKIPNQLTRVQIRPSYLRRITLPGEEYSELTIRLPGNTKDVVQVTIDTVYTPSSDEDVSVFDSEFPLIEVVSANVSSEYCLLDPQAPQSVASESGQRVSVVSLPQWTEELKQQWDADEDIACFQLNGGALKLVPQRVPNLGQPRVFLTETIVWPRVAGETSTAVTTQVWLNDAEAGSIEFTHAETASIHRVIQQSGPVLKIQKEPTRSRVSFPKNSQVKALTIHWEFKEQLELLQFPQAEAVQNLVAFVNEDYQRLQEPTPAMIPIEVWLNRWEALLNALNATTASVSVDSLLLQTVRMCESNCQRLLRDDASGKFVARYQELMEKWDLYRSGMIVSVDEMSAQRNYSPTDFNDLLGEARSSVTWTIPAAKTLMLKPQSQWKWGWPLLKLLLLVAVAVFVVRSISVLTVIPDQVANYPDVSFLVLGVLWWLFLAPSFVGMLIAFSGVLLRAYEFYSQQKLIPE